MSFLSIDILPGEHYVSWFVRKSQFQAYPDFRLFLSNNTVSSSNLKTYEVIHPLILSFLQQLPQKDSALEEHTLIPLWQLSVGKILEQQELIEGDFLDLHHSNNEKTLFQFDRSWHSCPNCREEDIQRFGTSYWHTEHQVPSVYKCYKHNVVLEKAKYPIADLISGLLPHQVKSWVRLISLESEQLEHWQTFVRRFHNEMINRPSSLVNLRYKIQKLLGIEKSFHYHGNDHTDQLTVKLEDELSSELLSYLYTDYARPSKKGKPKIIRNLFKGINPHKVRSPINWILLGYWLCPEEFTT